MKCGCIYALLADSSGVRYVGLTTLPPEIRLSSHIYTSKKSDTYKSRWIRKVLKSGGKISIEILESDVPESVLPIREMLWIHCLKSSGLRLTNATDGGEGVLNPSIEVRWKIGKANRGKIFSAERLKAMAQAHVGLKHTNATKMKMSASQLGKTHSDESKLRMSLSHKGCYRSPEASAKAAAKLRGQKRTAETKAKQSNAQVKKPIIDQNGVIYAGINIAAKALNLRQSKISSVLHGRRKTTGGYSFTYLIQPT